MTRDMNSGYHGFSMSVRAYNAYQSGEMPKSKWTKKAMLEAIDETCEGYKLDSTKIHSMKKDQIFNQYFISTSWHHTSMFCNATDFYEVNADALMETLPELTDDQIQERTAKKEAARKAIEDKHQEEVRLEKEYISEHGYDPKSVKAYITYYPDRATERTSKKGNVVVDVIDLFGKTKTYLKSEIEKIIIGGFNDSLENKITTKL